MLNVLTIHKPTQAVATARAVVRATDETWDAVVNAGLTALGETRTSTFGHGIEGLTRDGLRGGGSLTGDFTVYAHRS